MMCKNKLTGNIIANISQTVFGAFLLFVLYYYINVTLGVEQLGIWSVVLATTSLANLVNLGLSGGVVRYVARDRGRGDLVHALQVVDTGTIAVTVLVGGFLPLLYLILIQLFPRLFNLELLDEALSILPLALFSFWLTIVSSVICGALDGCERMDLRAGLVIGGQLFLLLLAFFLIPRHGLSGLAWAQIGQGLLLVIGGRLMLRKSLPGLTLLPLRWCKKVLREILVYGANIQLATLFGLMVDPITKVLMLHFGGVAASGYFEICNQLVLRVRSLIVMANQAVVPSATLLTETQSIRIREFYLNNMKILIFFLLPLMAFLFSWAGCVSLILLGEYKDQFVAMLGILTIAWTLNTFCAPVYFINIGSGRVGWNTFSHAIMGVLNGGLGWLFGMLYGSWGVLAGYVLALVAGGVVLLFVFHRQQGLSWRMILDREHVLLVLVCIATVGIYWWNPLKTFSFPLTLIDLVHWLAAPCILVFAMWTHRLRKMIWYSIFIK